MHKNMKKKMYFTPSWWFKIMGGASAGTFDGACKDGLTDLHKDVSEGALGLR